MAMTKQRGNMYQWVTHTHSTIRGSCPHRCRYCYVQAMERGPYGMGHYKGDLRLIEKELSVRYGSGKAIFHNHCNDMFAEGVPREWIMRELEHCRRWPENEHVFQSKNPARMLDFRKHMPANVTLGTTVETDKVIDGMWSELCPVPERRMEDIWRYVRDFGKDFRLFITVEPILEMRDPVEFARAIASCKPDFVNIGADSKGAGLPEPSTDEVLNLIDALMEFGIEIKRKTNLDRLLKGG